MKRTVYLFIIILAVFSGCERIRISKLHGTWELANIYTDTASIKYTYQFTENWILYSFENDRKIDSCEYNFYVENLKNYLIISKPCIKYLQYNERLRVVKLNKKMMVLTTEESKKTAEFSRVD